MLRSRVYGESDKILTFLTRDHGKLSAIAKGALRSRRRFVNSLEPFAQIRLGFRQRPGNDLAWVESAEIVRASRNVTRDLDRYAYSTYVLEVIDCMVEGREAEPAIFDLAEECLRQIDETSPAPLSPDLLRFFEMRLLGLCGFEPRLDACGRCHAPTPGGGNGLRFNPRSDTLLCADCSDGSGMSISGNAIGALLELRGGPIPVPPASATEVRILLQTAIAHHVRRPLRSPALLREILGR